MKILNKKAISVIEYSLLIVIVIGAFLIMQNYIQRGMYGNWAKTGQSFAFGRQYDPQKTIDCSFDEISNRWYDRNCFQYWTTVNQQCAQDTACEENLITNTCSNSSCSQLNNGASL